MALNYTITKTVTTASSDGCLRLFHGTLSSSVGSIITHGIDHAKLKEYGSGEFWATPDLELARYYAGIAEQQLMFRAGPPGQAIMGFDLRIDAIHGFQGHLPEPWVWVHPQGYQFSPECYSVLTNTLTNVEITFEE